MKKLALVIVALAFVGTVFAAYPSPTGYVNDFADILTQEQEQKLETKLEDFEKQTTDEIAVVTVKSTNPETIEEYSIHLAEQWKVGKKDKDNGIIMLFAMDDHKMRNEVGRGLEGSLTDIQSKHIQDNVIVPEFKSGNYYDGINKGVDQIILTIAPDSSMAATIATASAVGDGALFMFIAIVVIFLILLFIFIAVSPWTPLGGEGSWGITGGWSSGLGSGFGDSGSDSGSDGFGGGSFSGGGSSSSW